MKSIYKYTLKTTDTNIIDITSSNILSVAVQNENEIVVYALVDTNSPANTYEFKIIGTGDPIDKNISKFEFLGTVKLYKTLMFHVFYRYAIIGQE